MSAEEARVLAGDPPPDADRVPADVRARLAEPDDAGVAGGHGRHEDDAHARRPQGHAEGDVLLAEALRPGLGARSRLPVAARGAHVRDVVTEPRPGQPVEDVTRHERRPEPAPEHLACVVRHGAAPARLVGADGVVDRDDVAEPLHRREQRARRRDDVLLDEPDDVRSGGERRLRDGLVALGDGEVVAEDPAGEDVALSLRLRDVLHHGRDRPTVDEPARRGCDSDARHGAITSPSLFVQSAHQPARTTSGSPPRICQCAPDAAGRSAASMASLPWRTLRVAWASERYGRWRMRSGPGDGIGRPTSEWLPCTTKRPGAGRYAIFRFWG